MSGASPPGREGTFGRANVSGTVANLPKWRKIVHAGEIARIFSGFAVFILPRRF
jgi:hypothetical protein